MKNLNLLYSALIFAVAFAACKRKEKPISTLEKDDISSMPPPTIPTFMGDIRTKIDQWKNVSLGFARLLEDPSYCNNYDLMININNWQVNNGEDQLQIANVLSYLNASNFTFNKPYKPLSTTDFYDATADVINIGSAPTSINPWMTDFFSAFNYIDAGARTNDFFTNTISIPMREEVQNGQTYWNLPRIVGPDPELFNVFPAVFYEWDNSTQSFNEIFIADTEQYEDLIEARTHMVFVVGFDTELLEPKQEVGFCENGFVVGDGDCDGDCGENDVNSPSDCGSKSLTNRHVYLRDFTINQDIKDKGRGSYGSQRKYWERWASGKYRPGFSAWVVRSSGNASAIKKCPLERVKRKNVQRKRIRRNRKSKTWGSSRPQRGYEKGVTSHRVQVVKNYNPASSDLYFMFYEHDGWARQNAVSSVPLVVNGSTLDIIKWRGYRGNITSGKYNSFFWTNQADAANTPSGYVPVASDLYHRHRAFPTDWVDEVFVREDGAPVDVKVLYVTGQGFNRVDYTLMYARDEKDIYN